MLARAPRLNGFFATAVSPDPRAPLWVPSTVDFERILEYIGKILD